MFACYFDDENESESESKMCSQFKRDDFLVHLVN